MAAPSDVLALGLDKLHCNMSPHDAEAQYPFIKNMTRHPLLFALTNMGQLYIDDYAYAGCEFSGVLSFHGGKHFQIQLAKTAPAGPSAALPCREKIESELSSRYGIEIAYHPASKPKDSHWYPFSGSYGDFSGPITAVHYELNLGMEISFRDDADPTPPIILYDAVLQRKMPNQSR